MTQQTPAVPQDGVLAFLTDRETLGFVPTFERWLTPHAVWGNPFPPCPKAEDRAAYMALLHQYQGFSQMPFARVEIKNIAVNGNTVLTERIVHLYNSDRSLPHSAPLPAPLSWKTG